MSHPGFDFGRRSYHTLSPFSCPRRGYLSQMLQIRLGPGPTGWRGALNTGKLFHSLMELHYKRLLAKRKGRPYNRRFRLSGTDGQPLCKTTAEVVDYYASQAYSEETLNHGLAAFKRYLFGWPEAKDPLAKQMIAVEKDIHGDLRALLPKDIAKDAPPLPYDAQYDGIAIAESGKGVVSVEHKALAAFSGGTLFMYLNSGQVVGQCAVWNSCADLVERYGPMDSVWINIAFKDGKPNRPVHRESLHIPRSWQREYAEALLARTSDLEVTLQAYDAAQKAAPAARRAAVGRAWPKHGMFNGECVDLTRSCEFQRICFENDRVPDLYQITDAGRERAERDGLVRLESVGTYTNPNAAPQGGDAEAA